MNHALAASALLAVSYTLAASTHAQGTVAGLPPQSQRHAQPTANRAFTVDPSGTSADFRSLGVAAATVPSGSLLILKGGVHIGHVEVESKSLRIEAEAVGETWLTGELIIRTLGAYQEVSVTGLVFLHGFSVADCSGEVSFTKCTAQPAGAAAIDPDIWFGLFKTCGIGSCVHSVTSSDGVTFTYCTFAGRTGAFDGWDGAPGEHGLCVTDSAVSLYGCELVGGDGVQIEGARTELRSCDTTMTGGTVGYSQCWGVFGCGGEPVQSEPGAVHEEFAVERVTFDMPSVVRTGTTPFYETTSTPGALFGLMLSPR